ncbi:MAG: carbon-nitrogen hydrolase family protein [Spirochaetes bacterium]|nr:carbon-nitrogen hydrolase family protein [Spirochaetota bacterium]
MRILLYQQKLIGKIPQEDEKKILDLEPDFLCLPEYFFHPEIIDFKEAIVYLKSLSKRVNSLIIGGSTVTEVNGLKYNSCYLANMGEIIGEYRKVHLFHREAGRITPGNSYPIFTFNHLRIGILICADVLYPDSWQSLAAKGVDLIFIPTFSPYKEEDAQAKFQRDEEIFVSGARQTQALVVKVCGIGMYKGHRIQGRSLIADPAGILWRVKPEEEGQVHIKLFEYPFTKSV